MQLEQLKAKIAETDKRNLALFLSMESDQYVAVFLSLAEEDTRTFVINKLSQVKGEAVSERIKQLDCLNQYAINLVEFGLDAFNKRFPYPNYPIDQTMPIERI